VTCCWPFMFVVVAITDVQPEIWPLVTRKVVANEIWLNKKAATLQGVTAYREMGVIDRFRERTESVHYSHC
jgi:hypothetical protein